MNDRDQSAELQQLRTQLAELTRRVYHLEGLLSPGSEAALTSPAMAAPPPVPDQRPGPPFPVEVPKAPSASAPAAVKLEEAASPAFRYPPLPSQKPASAKAASRASLESRIGGQWLNRVGIIAVLVGLSYFLKLAFDNNWIGPTTQVLIGLFAGSGILFWSESFRRKGYSGFAYSLKAVGVGALYLSIWAASQYYHLVPPTVAFCGMLVVTIITTALSLRQNAELLAAFAMVGGFLTPVLISTGQNHEIALFCYIALLDLGTVWIVASRKWQRLIYGSIGGSALLFLAWVARYYSEPQLIAALVFLAFVFLLYTALAVHQDSEGLAGVALACAFGGIFFVFPTQHQETALMVILALLDVTVLWLTAKKSWRRLLAGSLGGTVILFYGWGIIHYAPAQVGQTVAFATLFFLLYSATPFLGSAPPRTKNSAEQLLVVLISAAAYGTACYLVLWNYFRLHLLVITLASAALYFVLRHFLGPHEQPETPLFSPVYLAIAIGFITVAIPAKLGEHWLSLGWLVEAAALFWAAHRSTSRLLRWLGVAALVLGVVRLILDSETHQRLLVNPRFGLYLVAIAALALLTYYALAEGGEENRIWAGAAVLSLNVLALLALHFEVVDYFQLEPLRQYSAAELRSLHIMRDFTYSAIWMIYGSALMLVGFWKRSAFLRWQAIVLLALTAAKVFFYDIAALERGYRIAAFIVLGGVLLAVSFFYQRSRVKNAE